MSREDTKTLTELVLAHFSPVNLWYDSFGEPGNLLLTELTAPNSSRRADVVSIGLLGSRGHSIDVVECKTSLTDFKTEIADHGKAEAWWPYSSRFWIAAPSVEIAPPELIPPGWGLMVPKPNGRIFKTIIEPSVREPQVPIELFAMAMKRVRNVSMDEWRQMKRDKDREAEKMLNEQRQELTANAKLGNMDVRDKQRLDMLKEFERELGVEIKPTAHYNYLGAPQSRWITPATAKRTVRRMMMDEVTAEKADVQIRQRVIDDIRRAEDNLKRARASAVELGVEIPK